MNDSLNILQICPRVPYPPIDGGKIGIFNITKHLAERGHRITMLAYGESDAVPEEMSQCAEVIIVKHDTRTSAFTLASNLFSSLPYTVSKYQSQKMASAMRSLLAERDYDIVHVDHAHLAPFGALAKEEFGVPYCLREHNFEATIYERFAAAQSLPVLKQYLSMQAKRMRRYEIGQLALVDLCLAITNEDAKRIREEVDVPLIVVPAGVDLTRHVPLSRMAELPHSILIVGSLAWQPQRDSVFWFLDKIFPRIRQQVPDASVTIAGMSPPKDLRERASDSVHIPGFVEDLDAIIARSQVLAIPLRIGGGMRIKILEFFAKAKAVVSTSIGAEGNIAENGAHYLAADSEIDFANAVIELFQSDQRRSELGDAAREFVEKVYSWQRIAAQIEQAYMETIARVRGNGGTTKVS